MPNKRRLLKRIALTTLLVAIALVGVAAVAVQFVDIHTPQLRQAIAHRLSERLDAKVSVQAMDLRWHWPGPALHLTDVRIAHNDSGQSLRIPSLELDFSLLDLARGSRLPEGITLYRPKFEFTLGQKQWHTLTRPSAGKNNNFDWSLVARMRNALNYVAIKNARVTITVKTDTRTLHFQLDPFNATLRDKNNALILAVNTHGDEWLDRLTLQARIVGTLPNIKRARLSLDTDDLSPLRLWQKLTPDAVAKSLSDGQTDLQLTAYWRSGHFAHGQLRLNASALHSTKIETAVLPSLEARFKANRKTGDTPKIEVKLASLTGDDPALKSVQANASFNTQTKHLTLRAAHIAAPLLAPWIRLRFDALHEADINGVIKAAEFTWSNAQKQQLAIIFDEIALETQHFEAGPVSGHYKRHNGRNFLRFTDAGGKVRIARYLKGAVPTSDLGGQLSWQTTPKGLRVKASDLRLTSEATNLSLNGTLTLPDDGVPTADITAHLTTPDASVLLAHVPQTQDMPFDRLRDWLPKAIDAGDVTVDAYVTGPLNKIFAGEGKHLGITIKGTGFAMEYKPGWPRLTHAAGTIRLLGDTLSIDIKRSRMLGVGIGAAEIQVENVREPVLFLTGTITKGSAPRMLSFLAQSPLQERFGKLVKVLEVHGKAGLDLDLRLPLKEGHGDIEVTGTIHTKNNTVDHEALPAPIRSVSGDIHFSMDGLRAENLHGRLLDVKLTTDIAPAGHGQIKIVSHGQVALPENSKLLTKYLPDPWLDLAHGSAMAEVRLRLSTRGDIAGLTIQSDLQGMALELPPPIHKPMNTSVPLVLHVHEGDRLNLSYGDSVHTKMQFDGHELQRAIIKLGTNPTLDPPAGPGLWLGGHLTKLPAKSWLKVLDKLSGNDSTEAHSGQTGQLPLLGANLNIDTLKVGALRVRQVRLHVEQLKQAAGWKIAVSGPNARGNATWRPTANAHSTLNARFARLFIEPIGDSKDKAADETRAKTNATLTHFDPRRLPELAVTINRLHIGSTKFGKALVKAGVMHNGWRLQKASLSGGALTLHANGSWQRHVGLTQAELDFRIKGRGLARLLKAFDYDPAIKAKDVAIQASLQVAPNPHGISLAYLNGNLSLTIKDGVIQSIEPGAGRLLGLFNLYVLPRRLTLDFSDVLDEGLAFSKISGDFKIISGDAFTHNLKIQTTSASIQITGRISMENRQYDQTVTITPKLGSGLTIAGAILGGPVVGAAVFALQELLEVPLGNASSITYQLQGSWGNPKIVNPHASK